MFTKFVRLVAAMAVMVSIAGNTGVARADRGAMPAFNAQNSIPPASSLGFQFVHIATAANIVSDYTVIDHPATNDNPNVILLVTPNQNPGGIGGTAENHPIGVWYANGKWRVFNQDATAMSVNTAFNVLIPTAGSRAFVHTATTDNKDGNHTYLDSGLTNDKPNANVFVTPNYNPGGTGGTKANFPIGVFYDTTAKKWAIFNRSSQFSSMPVDVAFNVYIPPSIVGVFVHTATATNISGSSTLIDNALTNENPNAMVFVTPNYNPGGVGGTSDSRFIGMYYNGGKWRVANQDGGAMLVNSAFNVMTLIPSSAVFVHKAKTSNTSGMSTYIDSALTNGNQNAIVFVTSNLNPGGGVGGTSNNRSIGVNYDNGVDQWVIFNQNGVSMPIDAAFNVLVPNPDTSVFTHKAVTANISGHATIIDHPLTNGKPNALLFITPNYNPGGIGGTFDNHPVGVGYDSVSGKWRILNQDLAAMPVNAAFNVFVPTAGPSAFVHTASAGNSLFNYTNLDNILTNNNPDAIIFATPNYNPGGIGGTYANFPIGVFYNSTDARAAIFNQVTSGSIPSGTAFNVYIYRNYKLHLPLIKR